LALKGLEAERDRITDEIAGIRKQLGRSVRSPKKAVAKNARKRRKMTTAQRKLLSKRMKAAWARRKK